MSALPPQVVDLGFVPRAHQRAAHALLLTVQFLVLVWHRRAGKTVFAIVELILAALACKDPMGRYGYVAPLLKQAKAIAWDYLKAYARLVPGTDVNESELKVTFPNGVSVRLFGADNPESFRGQYFNGVVVDEPADMKPNIWGEILVPCLADKSGWALFIGTPKGVNLFSQIYFKALKGDGWGADLKRWNETDALSQEQVATARKEMSDTQWAQEMECDFAASVDDVLIRLEDVLAAQRRDIQEREYKTYAKVIGVDVARYGSDRTCIVKRQGPLCRKPRFIKDADGPTVAGQVAMEIDEFQPDAVFVDVGGVGASVFDQLKLLRYSVVPVDFGHKAIDPRFENRRAEMWWNMGKWVQAGAVLPSHPDVALDLTAPRYTYKNHRGRFQLESKDDMRERGLRSPDFGDALATTFYAPVAPRGLDGLHGRDRRHTAKHEYDPMEAL